MKWLWILVSLILLFINGDILLMRWGFSQIPGQVSAGLVYSTLLVNCCLIAHCCQLVFASVMKTKNG